MDVRITPGALSGTFAAIPSKSDAHRLLICAALADGPTRIQLPVRSADMDATVGCLRALGAAVTESASGELTVRPGAVPENPVLNCGESGSTLRFLLPVAAALCGEVSFTGEGRLPQRPLGALLDAMGAHGAAASAPALPLTVRGRLRAGSYTLPGDVSSQFISGLLLALPLCAGDSELRLTSPLQSAAYVDMTLGTLARFGVRVDLYADGYGIPGGQRYRSPGRAAAEGDWSNAAFFLTAGALSGGVACTGLDAQSRQADLAIAALLRRFGAAVEASTERIFAAPGELTPQDIDVSEFPDLFPILAVLACGAKGTSTLYNAARLRLKESDRIACVAQMLRDLGAEVSEAPDALAVTGRGELSGGETQSFNDHRIAMAAAAASVLCRGDVILRDAQAVSKSYPAFFDDFTALGGNCRVL